MVSVVWRTTVALANPLIRLYTPELSSPLARKVAHKAAGMSSLWQPPPPCRVGDEVSDIDTPALVVDLETMSRNMKTLSEKMKSYPGVMVRPHCKAHKCPQLATIQLEYGAVGVCCQTLVEAEAMVYGAGIGDVLVSNQVIGKSKLKRLAKLAQTSRISVCVDSLSNLQDISETAKEVGVTIDCVVEVNVGQDRCGVEPGKPAVDLARHVLQLPNITFKGIQCYNGWNQHVRKESDRKKAVDKVVNKTKQTLQALKEEGIQCSYVTGGGTGTYHFEAGSGLFTEVQPGSYIFMDVDYNKNLDASDSFAKEFDQSLFVIGTIQSIAEDRAVVDVGLKAVSLDSGVPMVKDHPDVVFHNGGDEHGILRPGAGFKVGDLVWLIPGHCDPTVNMYDWLIGLRNNRVECLWPVLGRGPGI